jgi:2'-5' RNA ligase
VSGKKADSPRYWITYLIRDYKEGDTFKPSVLHLTVIPWFVTNKDHAEVVKTFRQQFEKIKKFKVFVNGTHEFKSRRKIPVNIIYPSKDILALHRKALNFFDSLECRWAIKNPYVGEQYVPHVRRRPGRNLSEGDELEISSISMISANRRGDDARAVAAKVAFK